MTNTTNTIQTTQGPTIENVQVYWDTQDPTNLGWALRYEMDGTEWSEGTADDLPEDADPLEVAKAAALELPDGWTHLVVYGRGDQPVLRYSGPEDWRYL